jgi:hypothetical protein
LRVLGARIMARYGTAGYTSFESESVLYRVLEGNMTNTYRDEHGLGILVIGMTITLLVLSLLF